VLDAVDAGDAVTARAAMERHVEATYDWIVGLRLGLA
jgi:DNA-binding FadR family transcriptional regulator